jgi:hypothetical protein
MKEAVIYRKRIFTGKSKNINHVFPTNVKPQNLNAGNIL